MTPDSPIILTIALQAAAGGLLVKTLVDMITRAWPLRPAWVAPPLAVISGIIIMLLLHLAGAQPFSTATLAMDILAGLVAGMAAVGATELSRATMAAQKQADLVASSPPHRPTEMTAEPDLDGGTV